MRREEKGTPVGVVYRAQGPALGSWEDQPPAAYEVSTRSWRGTPGRGTRWRGGGRGASAGAPRATATAGSAAFRHPQP
eukprot:1175957-Prorocentrum_minimum.AAC.3